MEETKRLCEKMEKDCESKCIEQMKECQEMCDKKTADVVKYCTDIEICYKIVDGLQAPMPKLR